MNDHRDTSTKLNSRRRILTLIAAVPALFVFIAVILASSPSAKADPSDPMTLGEFITTSEVWVQKGCVSSYKDKPNYVTFSTIYVGLQDAALQLEHVVNGQWVTSSFEEGLRMTVDGDQHDPSQPFVALRGGANQRFEMTVYGVQPNEVWRLRGGHSYGPVRTLAAWSAAERNECFRAI